MVQSKSAPAKDDEERQTGREQMRPRGRLQVCATALPSWHLHKPKFKGTDPGLHLEAGKSMEGLLIPNILCVCVFLFLNILFYTGAQLIGNVVLVSYVQQSESVYIHMYLFFL